MTAVVKVLIDMKRNNHFRHRIGPAKRSIRNATPIFAKEMENMQSDLEMVFNFKTSGSSCGVM